MTDVAGEVGGSVVDRADSVDGAIDCSLHPVDAARHLAAAFDAGRRLVIHAPTCPDHGHHVAVEFLHPVVTGTVALPAVAGPPTGRSGDVLLAIGGDSDRNNVELWIPGGNEATIMSAYHLLWELVQLLLTSAPEPGGDSTDFLYPFLEGDSSDNSDHLESSARAKTEDSLRVASEALESNIAAIASVSDLIVSTMTQGRRVLTMGNGGSACDAARAVRLLSAIGVDTQSLSADYAVVSALANDLGAERVFARQVEALGRTGDVLLGFSTSGTSANLLAAFDQAKVVGMSTVGFAGYDGEAFETHPAVEHTVAVASQSVHRIQEAQAVVLDAVVERVTAGLATKAGSA